eukprot:360019-Chlamydomonas_euryale.AAC.14
MSLEWNGSSGARASAPSISTRHPDRVSHWTPAMPIRPQGSAPSPTHSPASLPSRCAGRTEPGSHDCSACALTLERDCGDAYITDIILRASRTQCSGRRSGTPEARCDADAARSAKRRGARQRRSRLGWNGERRVPPLAAGRRLRPVPKHISYGASGRHNARFAATRTEETRDTLAEALLARANDILRI